MSIIIQPVEKTEENGKLIMIWRNDKNTREMSFDSKIKSWDTFKMIFEDNYFNNYLPPLFAYYNNEKAAFIGFICNNTVDIETTEEICKIGINLNPYYRGKGLGKLIIKKSIEYIKINYPFVKKIIANIKSINIASIKVFESCNFEFVKIYQLNNEKIYKYKYII